MTPLHTQSGVVIRYDDDNARADQWYNVVIVSHLHPTSGTLVSQALVMHE